MPLISAKKGVASVSSGHTAISLGPIDTCKTPSPGGPVPVPYPNTSLSANPGSGFTTKTMGMGSPIWTKKGKTMLSNGDNAGTLLGIMSNKVMGQCEVVAASNDVKAEGGGLGRTLDQTNSNI